MSFFKRIAASISKIIKPQEKTSYLKLDLIRGKMYFVSNNNDVEELTNTDDFKQAYLQARTEGIAAGIADVTNKEIEIIQDFNSDEKILNNVPIQDVKKIEQISYEGLTARETGRHFAETALRTTSIDDYDTKELIGETKELASELIEEKDNLSSRTYDTFERVINWVFSVKLVEKTSPHYSQKEVDRLNSLSYNERKNEIDKIVFRLVRKLTGGSS